MLSIRVQITVFQTLPEYKMNVNNSYWLTYQTCKLSSESYGTSDSEFMEGFGRSQYFFPKQSLGHTE